MTEIEDGKAGERQRSDAHDEDPFLKLYYAGATFVFWSPPRQEWRPVGVGTIR
jgi:hypothetical protein